MNLKYKKGLLLGGLRSISDQVALWSLEKKHFSKQYHEARTQERLFFLELIGLGTQRSPSRPCRTQFQHRAMVVPQARTMTHADI